MKGPLGPATRAVVSVAVAPVRESPSHRAQRVTDWVLGEALTVLEREGEWVRTRGPDGYEGWVPAGPLTEMSPDACSRWERSAALFSEGVGLVTAGRLARLPWGARVADAGEGEVALPGGARARPLEPHRLGRPEEAPTDVVVQVTRIAHEWLGVPYAWGGRTELGVDCSGYVQALYARYGVRLPRDSHAQRGIGADLAIADPVAGPDGAPREGDLLFFAPEGRGITHVALSLGGWRIAHAASSNGCVSIDDLSSGEGALARRLGRSIVACTRPVDS